MRPACKSTLSNPVDLLAPALLCCVHSVEEPELQDDKKSVFTLARSSKSPSMPEKGALGKSSALLWQQAAVSFFVLPWQQAALSFCVLLWQQAVVSFCVLLWQQAAVSFCVLLWQQAAVSFCVLLGQQAAVSFCVLLWQQAAVSLHPACLSGATSMP